MTGGSGSSLLGFGFGAYDRDEEGYYAFFVFDPDGMRIEVFCWPRADCER